MYNYTVYSSGRTGRSYAGAAATASVNKNENEISEANNGDLSSASEAQPSDLKLRGKKLPKAQRRAMVEAFVHKYDPFQFLLCFFLLRCLFCI